MEYAPSGHVTTRRLERSFDSEPVPRFADDMAFEKRERAADFTIDLGWPAENSVNSLASNSACKVLRNWR